MNWDDTGDAIQRAIERSSGVTTIWKGQNAPSPNLDYIAISLSGLSDLGLGIQRQVITQDLTRPRGEEIKIEMRNDLESTLDIECFTANSISSQQAAALSLCMRTVSGMWLPSSKGILQRQAVSVFDYSPVQWIPDIPSTKFRGRAISTLRVYMRVPTAVEYVGYIERVRGRVIVHGTASGGSSGIAFPFDSQTVAPTPPPPDPTYLERLQARNPLHLWLLNNPTPGTDEPDLGSGGLSLSWSNPQSHASIIPAVTTTAQLCVGGSQFAQTHGFTVADPTSPFRIQWWIKPQALQDDGQDLFNGLGWSNALEFGIDSIGAIHVHCDAADLFTGVIFTSTAHVSVNALTVIGVSFDGTTAKLYVNGVLDSQRAMSQITRSSFNWFINPTTSNAIYQVTCYEETPGSDTDWADDYAAALVSA